MWLTETYLAEPGADFPAYAYFLSIYTPTGTARLSGLFATGCALLADKPRAASRS